jgi:hypothetical protein
MHGDGIADSLPEASMNSRKLTALTIIAGVLALGEFGSALMIWLEHTGPAAGAVLAVLFGLFFLLGAWLLRSGRITAGTIFVGLLCQVEVAGVPTYTRHNAGDWMFQMRTRVLPARLRRLSAMSLLILRTGLGGVPGDAVGGEPGGVGGARRPRFPGSPCFSAPPRSRASPRPSLCKGHCGSGRRLRAVPRGRPATGGRAPSGILGRGDRG